MQLKYCEAASEAAAMLAVARVGPGTPMYMVGAGLHRSCLFRRAGRGGVVGLTNRLSTNSALGWLYERGHVQAPCRRLGDGDALTK